MSEIEFEYKKVMRKYSTTIPHSSIITVVILMLMDIGVSRCQNELSVSE